jgi:hypothetical protein
MWRTAMSERPKLHVLAETKREPSAAMLKLAETILERVKSGNVVALAAVAQYYDESTSSSVELDAGCRPVALIGELAVIHGDLVRHEADFRRGMNDDP